MSNLAASPEAYRQGAVLAASRGQLVVMLYDGARRFLRQAAVAMREGQIERGHNTLRRAELIIAHLDGTIDDEQGELSERLHSIYMFSLRHLSEARFERDPSKLEEVSALLGELREAWAQVAAGDDAR
jgi:flagellar secretion chaperone FliS